MRKRLIAWLAVAAAGICLAGCKSSAPNLAYPNDPLLISKKPVEGKPTNAQPVLVADRGPTPPSAFDALGETADTRLLSRGQSPSARRELASNQITRVSEGTVLLQELSQ